MDAEHRHVYASKVVAYAVMKPAPPVGPVGVEASVVVGYAAMGQTPGAFAAVVVSYAAMGFSLASDVSVLVGYAALFPPYNVGRVLAYSGDSWTFSPTSIAREWRRDGLAIPGATAATYTLAVEDVGALITVALIASNASGASEAVISNDVGPIRA